MKDLNKTLSDWPNACDKILDSDKSDTEKKNAFIYLLEGEYNVSPHELIVYRSPSNRMLLAIRCKFHNLMICKVNVAPHKVINTMKTIKKDIDASN